MHKIQSLIFDMDGLIIDSEPFWRTAMMGVFHSIGIEANEEMCAATAGLRIDEVVDLWYARTPWDNKPKALVCNEIIESVCDHISSHGKSMPGFFDVLDLAHQNKYEVALASSSNQVIIHTVLKKLNVQDAFHVICSGQEVSHGKPHPAIFLETAHRLNVAPRHCTVFEDSVFGMIATKAAHMHSIVVPEKNNYDNKKFGLADIKLQSLEDFNIEMVQ